MQRATGYEPLDVLKPVARDIWIIDGPAIRFYGMPFSTRATVVRLANRTLWVHSPILLSEPLRAQLDALGPVAHLIAPNWIHYAHIASWQAAWPEVQAWAAPGVRERAASRGMALNFDHDLGAGAPPEWRDQIDQMIVPGSRVHREAVFFHRVSRTLILTDLIENFDPAKLNWWMGTLARLAGIAAPRGGMPPDMKATFDKTQLAGAVNRMIAWGPDRVILSHGRWFESRGAAQLRRVFAGILQKAPPNKPSP
jgi:uncharacterized protein DUF4336